MPETPVVYGQETRWVETVNGPVSPDTLGVTDAHNHVWIEPLPGLPPGAPALHNQSTSLGELKTYRVAGGSSLVDCQPVACGRNGTILSSLALESRVYLVGCTGFHLRKYYPPDHWLWSLSVESAGDLFESELSQGMRETLDMPRPVRAGFIKVACEATLAQSPLGLLEAAAHASSRNDAAIEVHTEKGAGAEAILRFFAENGVPAQRLVICHIDKRADIGLHRELAREGVLLEYDTFFRPKYEPERNVWPLLEGMVRGGLAGSVALATDLADEALWLTAGAGPGLAGLLTEVRPRLYGLGFDAATVRALTGLNIAERLSRRPVWRNGFSRGPEFPDILIDGGNRS